MMIEGINFMTEKWGSIFADYSENFGLMEYIKNKAKEESRIYETSIRQKQNTVFYIAKEEKEKVLVLSGSDEYMSDFDGQEIKAGTITAKVCALSHDNCVQIRKLFPFMRPVGHGDKKFSFGLGDRLGVATPGQIRAARQLDVFPILAQQSMRELKLTGRTYSNVLDDVSWAVFQEGYDTGFGADGDHLKSAEEIKMALDCGYSMITLDCSEHIDNHYNDMDELQLQQSYAQLPQSKRAEIEAEYLSSKLDIDTEIIFSKTDLMKIALVYARALDFIGQIYRELILPSPVKIDFEASIDETTIPTSPAAHYYIASELKKSNIKVQSMAPRFCGEFQKGIDYIGNLQDFEKEFIVHVSIADHFGYRLSIHSGSDKFSVFPIIGQYTHMNVHVKTAGTNWLEAVRLIATKNQSLYRRMHKFALEHLDEARKYYHISGKPENIPDINTLSDGALPSLMDANDSRQLMHITYGLIMQAKDNSGSDVFKSELYDTLYQYEDDYNEYLIKHISRHFKTLGAL